MAISPNLLQFKSSGVYRLEYDKSQTISIPSNILRLVIGFSKKGIFNTPVLIQDSTFFTTVFGEIDTALERKGSFFHRTVLTCLDRGPVIALNLLDLDDNIDKSQFRSISTSTTMTNPGATFAPVSSFFNKAKFWYTSGEALTDTANNSAYQSVSSQRLLNVANVGRTPISVIFKKSDAIGFDVLAKEWYGVVKIPSYINENDYMSDFMVDAIIVGGDFSNYQRLSLDPIFGSYFDTTGLKKLYIDSYGSEKDGLTAFLSLGQVNVLGVYSGSLLPGFVDKNGNPLFIEDLVNAETSKTGALLSVDQTLLDSLESASGDIIDLVGHSIESEQPNELNFLSYYGSISENKNYDISADISTFTVGATSSVVTGVLLTASTALTGATTYGTTFGYFDTITILGPSAVIGSTSVNTSAFPTLAEYNEAIAKIVTNETYVPVLVHGPSASSVTYAKVISTSTNTSANTFTFMIGLTAAVGITGPKSTVTDGFFSINAAGVTSGGGTASIKILNNLSYQYYIGSTGIIGGQSSSLNTDFLSGYITNGDAIGVSGALPINDYLKLTTGSTNILGTFGGINPTLSNFASVITAAGYDNADFLGLPVSIGPAGSTIKTYTGNLNETLGITGTYSTPTNVIKLDNSINGPLGLGGFSGKIVKGQYLVMGFGETVGETNLDPLTGKTRLTKIISVKENTDPTLSDYQTLVVTTNEPIYIKNASVERYKTIGDFSTKYKFTTLTGYSLRPAHLPDGTVGKQNAILDVLSNTNIGNALADREVISYRYIVDSFEGTIEGSSKARLTKIAKKYQSALAICNEPSIKQFKNSVNPLFKFNSSSQLEAQYIATGGNLDLNPTNIFSYPSIDDGSNYSAFYGPNLIVRENGANISVPQAAYISNNYVVKHLQGRPFDIIAGPRRGIVSGSGVVGVEYSFDRSELDWIEPVGYNAVVNKKGFGLTINANQTAQQNIKSALSQVHVRELLIYIQDNIEAILKKYRWELNTAQNRLEIKILADNFMGQVLSDGGVYDFSNIMDTSNNTSEIIDNNMGILDTYIEPVRGNGILVHRTTILKTGAISIGNFI